jgi:membrane protease YdiL (CAAX protease family)
MAGIELFAPRTPRHRRTWTAAALILGVVFIILGQVMAAMPGLMTGLLSPTGETAGWQGTAFLLYVAFGLTAAITIGWVIAFERRGLAAIGLNDQGWKRFLRGYGLGLVFIAATVGVIAALGGYAIEGGGAFATASVPAALLPILILLFGFIVQGSTEEIVTRGWLMQLIASRHGLAVGIGLTSVFFGLLHAMNIPPSPELATGLINIVLVGVFLGLYAAREGSLWGVCGWHAAWNWLLGLGFGLEVSGQVIETPPLIVDLAQRSEIPWWITGATFGPEGSVVVTVILLAGTLYLALKLKSRDHGAVS